MKTEYLLELYGFILHPATIIIVTLFFYFKNLLLGLRVTELKEILENQKQSMDKINTTLESINRSIEKGNLIQAINTNNIKEKDENLKIYSK